MVSFSEAVLWDHFSAPSRLGGGKNYLLGRKEQSRRATVVPVEGGHEVGGGGPQRGGDQQWACGGDSEVGGGGREGAEILGPKCQVSDERVWKICIKSY